MTDLLDELDMLVALRRDLHAHPELGFEETRTSAIVKAKLEEAGLAVEAGFGGTGLVATLQVGNGTRAIGLRADMDALAMPETASDRTWKSTSPGKMHACGHDGHTTMLLGAARHLARTRNFSGKVHFIFQPAEEGRGGAAAMIADGVLEKFPMDAVYGLHNMPGVPVDEIAVVEGPQLASSDRWEVIFTGVGTHGGKPHLGLDAVTVAGQFLAALPSVVARRVDPVQAGVISACALAAGTFDALNVIPNDVRVGGTARAYSEPVRALLEADIETLASGLAAAAGITASCTYSRGMAPVINDPEVTRRAHVAAEAALGAARVRSRFAPSTAGDDFSEFGTRVPGCYVWLGNGPASEGALHHNTRYDFNDEAIPAGMRYWVSLVETELAA